MMPKKKIKKIKKDCSNCIWKGDSDCPRWAIDRPCKNHRYKNKKYHN